MDMDQFIDLCIILGCDYCEKIRGVGPKSAIKLIQEHKTIEKILKNVDGKKHTVPENWIFQVEQARTLFKEPDVDKEVKPEGAGFFYFVYKVREFSKCLMNIFLCCQIISVISLYLRFSIKHGGADTDKSLQR